MKHFIIDNSEEPIIQAVKKAFNDSAPVKLTIEHDGKTIVIPAYMSQVVIPKQPPYSLTITIESAAKPIEMI